MNLSKANMNEPWFPMIYAEKCDGCQKTGKPRCIEFCPNNVYVFKDGKAVVANPFNCRADIRCSACAPLCHSKAISFPKRNTAGAQAAVEDKDLLRKTVCPSCKKSYWTNRKTDVCIDCEKNGSST